MRYRQRLTKLFLSCIALVLSYALAYGAVSRLEEDSIRGTECYIKFSFSPDGPLPGTSVDFAGRLEPGQSECTVLSWCWTFGDENSRATGCSSNGQNAEHTYTSTGVYRARLVASVNTGGTSPEEFRKTKMVPVCSFEFSSPGPDGPVPLCALL